MTAPALAALQEAVKRAGSASALAKAIGISRQRMHCWLHLNSRPGCTPDFAALVEQETGVPRYRLCPDVFGKA